MNRFDPEPVNEGRVVPAPDEPVLFDRPDRIFHVELLRSGMNRLLYQSFKTDVSPLLLEVCFVGVQYLAIGTYLEGLTITDATRRYRELRDPPAFVQLADAEHTIFETQSVNGTGIVIAREVRFHESDAEPGDLSHFFKRPPGWPS